MSTAIKYLLFALMLASIASIGYWAAFDVAWWKPIVGFADEPRGMVLYILHMGALFGFPLYMTLPRGKP